MKQKLIDILVLVVMMPLAVIFVFVAAALFFFGAVGVTSVFLLGFATEVLIQRIRSRFATSDKKERS